MAGTYDPMQQAFESAMREFKASLKNESLYRQILETTSIEQVYDATDKIQKEQAKTGHLRHLSKIEIYLNRLREYTGAVDTFVQVKPDILALIWGPIKLILQWANVLKQSFDAIVNTLEEIGYLLPEFTEIKRIFGENVRINELLVLFFKDILDFYLITLQFFGSSRLKFVFEMLWPSRREKIKMVGELIKRHTLLMRSEVRLEEIREAHDARRRELENFRLNESALTDREYASIRANTSPKIYDKDLYRLHGNVCEGTGKWLFRDKTFQNWMDSSISTPKIMWFKGIPGSGKTHLAASVVNYVKSLNHNASKRSATLFAFLSYKESHTTALSIMHSLMFQLTDDSKTLQAALCQSAKENMRSSLDVAVDLLESLLKCAGLVYIVVDGIDEIEDMERFRLLKHLLQLSKNCDECRILLSSRSESDITAILRDNTASIEIHNRNSGSIQAYVKHRIAQWFQEKSFVPEFQAEIEGSLASLAHTAKGMFLYARVIFVIIWEIDSADELRNLLNCPPVSLNDAYERIFSKVNQSTNASLKDKARKILGWVGCAPSPLTRREIEQALLVNPKDTDGDAKVVSVLDVVRVCGPIVEVVDDHVQFVHFTAKEYIFHNQTSGYIALSDATLSLTICCITYLCQGHHDLELLEEDISSNLVSGAYRFHDFASLFWFELLKQFLVLKKAKELPRDLEDGLERLHSERSAWTYETSTENGHHIETMFDFLGPKQTHLQQMLKNVSGFQKTSSNAEYHLGKEARWIHLDPLTISLISVSIYNQLDRLLCPTTQHERSCACSAIQHHYGSRAFKCGFLRCQSRRHGFEARSDRKSHEKHHEQPWKCDVPGCEYSSTGFLTRKWRDCHLQSDHQPEQQAKASVINEPDEDEIQPLLFDLIGTGNVELIRALLPRFGNLPDAVKEELSIQAAALGSSAMLDVIQPNLLKMGYRDGVKYRDFHLKLCTTAIKGKNVDTSKWLIDKMSGMKINKFNVRDLISGTLVAIITSESREMLDLWKATILSICINGFEVRILERLDRKILGDGLVHVASTTCSINLARTLLNAGAEVDWRRSDKYQTPLHCAARKTTEEAAKLMELLLYHGADPATSSKNRKLEDEDGTSQISKWLGVSWDELVEKTKSKRETKGG
ncbi:NACHT domain protein [Colletotrichum truncatum]|uniref:NACHT domain protein n=1 Tax=Colletotrichum truncatum TaxID=5467 RepID=A0ACC3Z395_COLTU